MEKFDQENDSQIEFTDSFLQSLKSLEEYDSKLPQIDKEFACGTSGFRYDENELDKISFRIGIVTAIKSQFYGGLPMGIMVTASHNKYTDNGFKIAGIDGESITKYWEDLYTEIVNSKNLQTDLKNLIVKLCNSEELHSKYFFRDNQPILVYACDTRRSSPRFVNIITDCFKILNVTNKYYGVQTTPALHFLTLLNQYVFKSKNSHSFNFVDSEEYWKFLKNGYFAFNTFLEKFYATPKDKNEENKYENELTIDCSNGIAGYHYKKINSLFDESTKIHTYNYNYIETTSLNDSCGAEFVHKEKKLPVNYGKDSHVKNLSFDGDVDRVVYL
jgi:phosphoacetylglucosamine mutase